MNPRDPAVSEIQTPLDAKPGWRLTLPLLLVVVAWTLFWYRDTMLVMVGIWARSETFTHGFVVPPIALWLTWQRRRQLACLAPSPSAWILVAILATGVVWLLGELAAVNALTQFAATAMVVLGIVAVIGVNVARAVAFPIAFLFFAVPVGEFMLPVLMEWTANFTVAALRASGVPVFREGLNFVIPSGNWSVVEACSGVRYLIASLMVGTLFAYLNYHSLKRRLIFVAVAAIVPIVANWLRAYMIVMLGHLSGNTLAVGVDHLIYGWIFFGVVIMLMFMIGARWSEDPLPEGAAVAAVAPPSGKRSAHGVSVYVGALTLIAVPIFAHWFIERGDAATPPAMTLPAGLGAQAGWILRPGGPHSVEPAFENPSSESHAVYERSGSSVGLYIAYYRQQGDGHKLVTSTNALAKTSNPDWAVIAGGHRQLETSGAAFEVRTYRLAAKGAASTDSKNVVAWQWYWINGKVTASDYWAKVYTALSRLRGQGDDSAVIIVYTLAEKNAEGEAPLAAFVADTWDPIQSTLLQARNRR